MAIAFDSSGSTTGNSVNSLTVDITSAAVGAFVYCHVQIGTTVSAGTTMTGWTKLLDADEGSSSHYALWRRQKQSGDTTFSITWTNSQGACADWVSYTGLNSSTPDELATAATHTTSSASYVTPSLTPNGTGRWALAFAGARSTTSAETWTYPGSMSGRVQAVNSATRWSPVAAADSNGTVTQTSQSYTFTLSASEQHGASILLFLVPPSAAPTFVPAETTQLAGYF